MSERKEYIERGALIRALDDHKSKVNWDILETHTNTLIAFVIQEPAADVEPVVLSHWELHGNDDDLGSSWFCRKCGWNIDEESDANKWNRCPRCGAHMSGAK